MELSYLIELQVLWGDKARVWNKRIFNFIRKLQSNCFHLESRSERRALNNFFSTYMRFGED